MSGRVPVCILKYCSYKSNAICGKFKSNFSFLPAATLRTFTRVATVENTEVSQTLKPTIDETLSSINSPPFPASKSVAILKALRLHTMFDGISSQYFITDPRFVSLCEIFSRNCSEMKPSMLISGLRSLLEVGLPPNDPCVLSAQENILKHADQIRAFDLIVCLHFHKNFTQTDLQKELVYVVVKEIHKRIYEVTSAAEVLMLTGVLPIFGDSRMKKIQSKIIECMPFLKIHELCKVVCTLAEKPNRNVEILNAVSLQVQKKNANLGFKDTIDMLYAFKKLNFCDPALFFYLLNPLLPEIQNLKQPALISGFLTTCGHLRWRCPALLEVCGDWIEKNFHLCRTREFVAYILALAALNYSTPQSINILKQIVPHIDSQSVKSPEVLLDVAWSLAILDHIPKQLLIGVLSPAFYKPLIDVTDFRLSTNYKLKLLNLKGVLKLHHPEYIFATSMYLEPIKLPESTDIENCRKHIMKVLSNFVPKEKCLCINQTNDMGIFMDAEFIMDKNGKPTPLQDYGVFGKVSSGTKTLPEGAKRFCLLIMFHKDYTMNTLALTGINALAEKLLSSSGYKVVLISYDEFSKNKTEVQKAKFMKQKIINLLESM